MGSNRYLQAYSTCHIQSRVRMATSLLSTMYNADEQCIKLPVVRQLCSLSLTWQESQTLRTKLLCAQFLSYGAMLGWIYTSVVLKK